MHGQIELRLLLEQHRCMEQPRPRWAVAGTTLFHAVLGLVAVLAPASVPRAWKAPTVDMGRSTPLVAPPSELTQRNPGEGKTSAEVNLEGLLSRSHAPPPAPPAVMQPAAPRRVLEAPPPAQAQPKPLLEPPGIEIAQVQQQSPLSIGVPDALQIQAIELPPEKPKIAFERPGAPAGTPTGGGLASGRVPMPQAPQSADEMARQMVRGGIGAGLTVGDLGEGIGGLGDALSNPGGPTRQGSSLELLSDPMGVDFRPYLIRILSTVRRNWFAVIPESARLGRRGKVQVQFAINRDGSVPKLVISLPSGTEAFDRAAVAGISASNPFPPLPSEFQGLQIRLQFSFLYNIPAR